MANALEAASLVMIPSGYEDGTLGSLKPTDGSGDFTFSRGSNLSATRINEQGYIEKGYENLLLQSNTFSDAAWSSNTNETSGQEGYDGSNDAWKLSAISGASSRILQTFSISGVITISIYAKAAEWNYVGLYIAGSNKGVVWSLIDGTPQNTIVGYPEIYGNGESIGNGWWRFSITHNATAGEYRIYPCEQNIYNGNNPDGVKGIYIQDAMLNQGLVAYPYIETTTAPVAGGILEDMPRLDWSGSCPSLLLEPSRTNLIEQSEYFEGYFSFGVTLTTNYGTSPEGLQNSTRVVFDAGGDALYKSLSVGSGDETASIYVKGTSGETILFGKGAGVASGDLYTLNGDWQRITYSGTNLGATFHITTYNGATARDIEIWGAQVEQDATYPTSYIPTYGVSQTRLADDVELPSLSSVFDSSGDYTCFFEVGRLSSSIESQFLYIRSAVFNYITLNAYSTKLQVTLYDGLNSTSALSIEDFVVGTPARAAVKVEGSTSSIFINGEKIKTTNAVPRNFDRYQINRNHRKHQEVYFATALSDSECIALTTI